MKYTTTFKKAVLRKVLPPENRSVHSVSKEMGVGEITIHRWTLMANKSDDKDKEIKELKKQLAKKDKELKRKEAALAELAAIMTLKKSWSTERTLSYTALEFEVLNEDKRSA